MQRKDMDAEKTREYYKKIGETELCGCAYCQNYAKEVKAAYPKVAEVLALMGVDIEKPFETMPLEPDEGYIDYVAAQYVVLGRTEDFKETSVGPVRIDIAEAHPATAIKEEHFVIEISPIRLKWTV